MLSFGIYATLRLSEHELVQYLMSVLNSEHPEGYYLHKVRLVVDEFLWIAVFFLIPIYWVLSNRNHFSKTFHVVESKLLLKPTLTVSIIIGCFIIVAYFTASITLEEFPNSADEYAYLFQADDFSQGRLWNEVHSHAPFFDFHHIIQKDDKWISRFPPGWPIVLSTAFILNITPSLINILITALALLVLYKLVKLKFDERIALWSLLTISVSSFLIFNAASYFSHNASLLFILLIIYYTHLSFEKSKPYLALLAGVFLGLLFLTRPYNCVLILFYFVYLIFQHNLKAMKPIMFMGLASLPFAGLFLWYNYMVTGSMFVPVTMWGDVNEGIGFVNGHTFVDGIKHIVKRIGLFFYWASPHLLLLYLVYIGGRIRNYKKGIAHPEDFFFLVLIAAYFFYYSFGGNQYGPRFYLEAFPFLVIFVTARALAANSLWPRAFLLSSIGYCLLKIPFISVNENRIIKERTDLYQQVAENNLQHAVVLIESPTGLRRPMPQATLTRNDKDYQNNVLYALDLGTKNKELIDHYSDRIFYRYSRSKEKSTGRLIEVETDSVISNKSRPN